MRVRCANAFVASVSRLGSALARDGWAPSPLARRNRRDAPHHAILAVGGIGAAGLLGAAIFGWGTDDIVFVPSVLVLATYLLGTAAAVVGLLLVQSAFEAGPLRMSLPALTASEPLVGIACGIGFLGDRLRADALALSWQITGLAAIVSGVVLLARHPAMPGCAPPQQTMPREGDSGVR